MTATLLMLTSTGPAFAESFICPYMDDTERRTLTPMSLGKNGWAFRNGADFLEDFSFTDETLTYLSRLQKALAARGTSLVVIPIPVRGLIAADHLDRTHPEQQDYNPEAASESYRAYLKTLNDMGIITPDVLMHNTAGSDFYFKRDHHWRPEGARATAQAIATQLAGLEQYTQQPKSTYTTHALGKKCIFEMIAQELQRLCTSEISPETYTQYETRLKAEGGAEALFGDQGEASVLIGSSFSAMEWFNFDGFLSEATGLSIANRALSAGQLFNALVSYTSSSQFHQEHPPFLFWEAVMHYDFNQDTGKYFRQVIPAIRGECSPEDALASGTLSVKKGQGGYILTIPQDVAASGHEYFLFITSENKALSRMTLELDYDTHDGEWFVIDRSEHYKNDGRFFVELWDDIEGALQRVSISNMGNLNADVEVRLCKQKG